MSTAHGDLLRYKLGRVLGSGGMAIVYLADDRELARPVAIKLLADHLAADEAFRARFLREAQLAARLSHPHVVHVYDLGADTAGRPFIVMEYVPGGSLAETLERRGPLPQDRVIAIAENCCAGLAHAHAAGLVHRDLKPHNLLVDTDGRIKIADFGVARALGDAGLTQTGSVLGTAGYLAPEQARGETVTSAADIYSLGVTLYQLATGTMPTAGSPPDLAEPLGSAVTRCLDQNPARRPSALQLAAILRGDAHPRIRPQPDSAPPAPSEAPTLAATATGGTEPLPARPAPRVESPRRARYRLALLLLGLLVLATIVILATNTGRSGPPPAPAAHRHIRPRTTLAIPTAASPAAQARVLGRWLRQHAGS